MSKALELKAIKSICPFWDTCSVKGAYMCRRCIRVALQYFSPEWVEEETRREPCD